METITITKISEPKTVNYTNKKTGQPDSFMRVGLQCMEHGDRWIEFTYRGNHGLTVGQKIEVELESKEFNSKTYWSAKKPKEATLIVKKEVSEATARLENMITFKVMPALDAILARLPKPESKYPEYNESNDANGFDEPASPF